MIQMIYRRIYQPVIITFLRIMLWGFDWVMPEDAIEEGYEVISKYYGRQYRLPDRTAAIMGHLQLDQQEIVFNNAWELRKCQKDVDKVIEKSNSNAWQITK